MDEQAVDELVREFIDEYLPGKTKAGMERFRKSKPPVPEEEAPAEEQLPEECAEGLCEHPEHAKAEDLESLLEE